MNFSRFFSLGVKSTLLTLALLAVTMFCLYRMFYAAAVDTVQIHERQDLADETKQKAWEILDRVDLFRREVFQLSTDLRKPGVLDDLAKAQALLQKKAAATSRQDSRYLRLEIWTIQWQDGKLVLPAPQPWAQDGLAPLDLDDPSRQRFIHQDIFALPKQQSPIATSPQFDWRPRKLLHPDVDGNDEIFFSMWSGMLLDDLPADGSTPTGEMRVLLASLLLDDALKPIAESPRHLGFLWDVRRGELVLSPFGASSADHQAAAATPQAGIGKAIEIGQVPPFNEAVLFDRQGDWQTSRILAGNTVDQSIQSKLYFCESRPLFFGNKKSSTSDAKNVGFGIESSRLDGVRQELRKISAEKIIGNWRNPGSDQPADFARVGQLLVDYPRLRILASSSARLAEIQEKIQKIIDEFCEQEQLPPVHVAWNTAIPCQNCNISMVGFSLRGNSDHQRQPEYVVGRAAFKEELASSLNVELEPLKKYAFLSFAAAVGATLVFTSLIIKPLKRITKVAERIRQTTFSGDDSTDAWESEVSEIASQLPTQRRDEIGTLANSFGRMIQDVLENHKTLRELNRDLESRVFKRTESLTSANENLEAANHDLQAKQQELTEAQQRQKMFVFAISHDLKNPLSSVKTTCELLQHSEPLSEEQQEDLQTLYSQVCRLERLIKDILDYQKLGLGELELDPREFNLVNLIRDIEKAFIPVAQKNGNTLVIECDESFPMMLSDPDRIKQILENLLSNSCKFTRKGTVSLLARLTTEDGREWVNLQVSDTGGGIKAADQHKVFTPFPRLSKKSENPDGTGLGLSNCRGYCQALGGGISFTSEVGQGTTFFVRLPLTIDKSLWRPTPSKPRILPVSNGRPHPSQKSVLVIDDEDDVGQAMKSRLEALGFEVLLAGDGEEGLEIARTRQPGLITLDAIMPGEDGWTVLQKLKSDPLTSEIPVVMVTVLNDKFKGFTLGASDYVTKPIDWDLLVRKLRAFHPHEMQGPILIVDDEPEIRSRIIPKLTELGWRVVVADDGKQALAQVERTRPSIILLDLLMPEMDGFEFLERLRAKAEWNEIPVIVTTAKDLSQTERELLAGRVDQIITKDACAWELLEQEITRISRRHDELARMETAHE